MTATSQGGYAPARARQLRTLLLLVVIAGVLLALESVAYLFSGADPGLVLAVLALPAALLLASAVRARTLVGAGDPRARAWVSAAGGVTVLVGLLFSRSVPGLLLAVTGILTLLFGLLPAREASPARPRALVVQHADDCPPALLGTWLRDEGWELDVRRPYAGDDLPEPTAYDAFVVLGGPMGALDDERHPWLTRVKEQVREAVAGGVPTLGICLGHQLAAVALGGSVRPNPHGQQLGLVPVGWTAEAATDPLLGPLATDRRGVQWNDDVVDELPDGAVLLAATERGEVQAARLAPRVWGLQLHPEVDETVLRPWAESDRGSHEARGIDQDALLREVTEARHELDEAWRPLAGALTGVLPDASRA